MGRGVPISHSPPKVAQGYWVTGPDNEVPLRIDLTRLRKQYPVAMTLAEILKKSDHVRHEIWDAVAGPITIKDERTQLMLEYFSIAIEHHEAITLLTANDLRGSALALVRPIFEIMYKAAWVCTTATDQQVERIRADNFDFPTIGMMAADIDKVIAGGFFDQMKKLSWSDQNQFTHTGKLLRIGRFTGHDLQPSYPDQMLVMQINTTLIAVIIVAVLFLRAHDRLAAADHLEAIVPTLAFEQNYSAG